ncbi:MAG: hypothetical protein KGI27_12995 [Thaumarchaeota archaeon]|nr:hypothetical protein [Nitrososphaerota archaeon]
MSDDDVELFLENFGATRFIVDREKKTVYIEHRQISEILNSWERREWLEFLADIWQYGWKIVEREHIPVIVR